MSKYKIGDRFAIPSKEELKNKGYDIIQMKAEWEGKTFEIIEICTANLYRIVIQNENVDYLIHEAYLPDYKQVYGESIAESIIKTEVRQSPKCTCDMFTMMNYGCKCGAFQAEMNAKGRGV